MNHPKEQPAGPYSTSKQEKLIPAPHVPVPSSLFCSLWLFFYHLVLDFLISLPKCSEEGSQASCSTAEPPLICLGAGAEGRFPRVHLKLVSHNAE